MRRQLDHHGDEDQAAAVDTPPETPAEKPRLRSLRSAVRRPVLRRPSTAAEKCRAPTRVTPPVDTGWEVPCANPCYAARRQTPLCGSCLGGCGLT